MIIRTGGNKMPQKLSVFKTHILLFLLLCVAAGVLFAFTLEEYWNKIQYENTYLELPVSSVFLYIFCVLSYLLQGLAFGIVAEHPQKKMYETAVLLFWAQFVLGLLWLGIFFGLRFFGTALFDLFTAFILLTLTFSTFRKIDLLSAYMLVPYGCLLIFVGALNIWFFLV